MGALQLLGDENVIVPEYQPRVPPGPQRVTSGFRLPREKVLFDPGLTLADAGVEVKSAELQPAEGGRDRAGDVAVVRHDGRVRGRLHRADALRVEVVAEPRARRAVVADDGLPRARC